jgi:hypothetical protein
VKYCFLILQLYGLIEAIPSVAQLAAQPRITEAIDNLSRTRIPNSKHPLAQAAFDEGAVDPGQRMERLVLVLGPTEEQEHQLRTFLDSQHTKGGPLYHKWLTPDEFGQKFGPSPTDLQTINGWLGQQGFSVSSVARSKRWIEFSGTSAQVEQAFQTQMRRYNWQGIPHIGNATDISIPLALSPIVRGVLSLHDSFSQAHFAKVNQVQGNSQRVPIPSPDYTFNFNNATSHAVTPGDFAAIYNLGPLFQKGLDGRGQTIAIVARSNINLGDVENFRQMFNLPANDPVIILNGPDPGVSDGEATLDAEAAGATAPGATVDVVVSSSTVTTDGVDLSALYVVDNNLAPVMSVSFGQCESAMAPARTAFFSALWQQASAQGISVIVSSGDTGAADCDVLFNPQPATGLAVNGIASTPFNTAVGGTEFNENGKDSTFWNAANGLGFESALGYIPEMVWNESCAPTDAGTDCARINRFEPAASGGGASAVFSKPSWQSLSLTGMPNDNARDLPDISLAAASLHDGYFLCAIGNCSPLSSAGTSVAAPSFAGIVAIADQLLAERQGLANYVLYALASKEDFSKCDSSNQTDPTVISPCVFYDITQGNNQVAGASGPIGFSAGKGYDLATGIGSVNAAHLVNAWSSVTFQGSQTGLSTPGGAITGTHGQAVTLTITVQALAGQQVPTGAVSLVTDTGKGVGLATLTNGSSSGSFSNLPAGRYNLFAHYPGDGTFGASGSLPIPVNIIPEASSITLGKPNLATIQYGVEIVIPAIVTANSGNGTPTGPVSFTDNGAPLFSLPLNSAGQVDFISNGNADPSAPAPATLTVGTHTISASYSGDSSFQPSGPATPVTVTVTKAQPSLVLEPGQSSLITGQQLALHVLAISGAPLRPTGTVQLIDNGSSLGSPVTLASLGSGATPQADFEVTLSAGTHNLAVHYSGDAQYLATTSVPTETVTVTAGTGTTTQTALTSSVTSTTLTQTVTYTVQVTSTQATPALTGSVTLVDARTGPVGQATLQNGMAVIPVTPSVAGSMIVIAYYSGDTNYAPSSSSPATVTVARSTPAFTLKANAPSVAANQQVSLSVTLAGLTFPITSSNPPLIQFFDSLNGGTPQFLGGLTDQAFIGNFTDLTITLPAFLPVGKNVITAIYTGNNSVNALASNPVTVTVTPALPFQVVANLSNLLITAGQSGTVIVTLSPNAGFSATTILSCGSGLLAGATCSFSPPSVTPDGFPVNSTLTISTVAPSPSQQAGKLTNTWWGISFGAGLAALLLAGSSGRRLRGKWIAFLTSVCLISFLLGCGGSGNFISGPSPTPTPSPSPQPTPTPAPAPINTSTSLSTPSTKVPAGSAFTLTATVNSSSGPTPAGTVTFFDGGAQIGQPVTIAGGLAFLNFAPNNGLAVGTHSFTATYNGSTQDNPSTSSPLAQVITGTVQVQITATSGSQSEQTAVNVTLQ